MKPRPYFMTNKDWYYYDEDADEIGVTVFLTDKAPPEAIEDYQKWWEEYKRDMELGLDF